MEMLSVLRVMEIMTYLFISLVAMAVFWVACA